MLPENIIACVINLTILIYKLYHGIYTGYSPTFRGSVIINYTPLFLKMQLARIGVLSPGNDACVY